MKLLPLVIMPKQVGSEGGTAQHVRQDLGESNFNRN